MNAYKMHRLGLPMGLLLSVSLPLQANSQASTTQPIFAPIPAQPIYAPQPAMPSKAPAVVAPEYIQNPAPVGQAAVNAPQLVTQKPANTPSVTQVAPAPNFEAKPQQPKTAMPPIGAFGYADDPATYAAPAYPMPNQRPAMPPMNYGYAPQQPYYGQAYPQAGYGGYPQWGPGGQNGNPFNNMGGDFFSGQNPFTNPMNNNGNWASQNFRPWSSGPLSADRWGNHPMNNMPWGTFPGWGDGFFGGFGPDNWQGVTPWGNDVPFRWVDPSDPRESIATIWDDAINTPNGMGRMPPGWTAPYISVPNPVDVADEFEKNARRFPDEINNMIDIGDD